MWSVLFSLTSKLHRLLSLSPFRYCDWYSRHRSLIPYDTGNELFILYPFVRNSVSSMLFIHGRGLVAESNILIRGA